MPLIIDQIKGQLDESHEEIIDKTLKSLKLTRDLVKKTGINKVSLDARKRNDIHFVYSVYIEADKKTEKRLSDTKRFRSVSDSRFEPVISNTPKNGEIVIAGFGPAGMFCGLVLAENGYKPVIVERGSRIEKRIKDVETYSNGGQLDTGSNIQFGEGGAGTFSDGKLTTRINDPLCRYVLEKFTELGAPEEILIKSKPHIGTDNLRRVVANIRERITDMGGRIIFDCKLEDMTVENGKVTRVKYGGKETETAALVLSVGHSARDTFEMLAKKNIFMQPKPFSVGVRIEHKQSAVNESLYGKYADDERLPVGEYQLSHRRKDGRCAYTFCMCPGGTVVPAASEAETVVTNGMSNFARDGENANAAIAVSVSEKDYGGGLLDGVKFARQIEKNAYRAAGKLCAPGCTVRGFLNGKPDLDTNITPTYARGLEPCAFEDIFPPFVTDMLKEGLTAFSKKMKCFGDENAVLTAPETRTSSPIRITRTEDRHSPTANNLYPCGEGAGYAGGIMSAAVDGVKTALAIMEKIGRE